MAQAKPEVNRSQIIRDFVKKNPTSPVPEIVAALAKNGVEVTKNHVYIVISKMKEKKQQKKAEKAAAAAPSSNGKAQSKSASVRAVLRENRHLTANEVVAALAEKGISVTDGLVYFVKGQMKGKRGRKKRTSQVDVQVATATVVSANGDTVKTILKIKGWATEIGGLKKLKALVDALGE